MKKRIFSIFANSISNLLSWQARSKSARISGFPDPVDPENRKNRIPSLQARSESARLSEFLDTVDPEKLEKPGIFFFTSSLPNILGQTM